MAVIKILKSFRNVAMVGVSANSEKPSNIVFRYLTEHGYNVIPVNPTINEVEGKKCYASLSAIPEKVEVVDIFRHTEDIPPIVDEAIKIGAKAVWMQEGIINDAAAKKRVGRFTGGHGQVHAKRTYSPERRGTEWKPSVVKHIYRVPRRNMKSSLKSIGTRVKSAFTLME